MKVGIISDLHSNFDALSTVLDYFDRNNIDKIICLGDIIGIGHKPKETVNLLMEYKDILYAIKGNHENYLINGLPKYVHGNRTLSEAEVYNHKWNHSKLSMKELKFLNSLEKEMYIKLNDVNIYISHFPLSEKGEGPLECAQREVREETGITIRLGNFKAPFYKLQCYEKNYYNLGLNYYTTIQFLVGNTDAQIDLNKRQLDENELKQIFTLEYIPYQKLREVLDKNREIAKKEQREFIIDEMLHVLDQYDEYHLQNKNIRGAYEER